MSILSNMLIAPVVSRFTGLKTPVAYGLDALLKQVPIGGFSSTADIQNTLTDAGRRALQEITDYDSYIKANQPYLVKDPVTGKMVQLTKQVPVKQLGPAREGAVLATGPQRYSEDTVSATELRTKGSYADGGSVGNADGPIMTEKEYVYGVGPEGSGIGQLLSPLLPVRREVIEPYQETFFESLDPGQMEREVTPGQYGEPELAVPEAVQDFLNLKGLARDPESREAVLRGIVALPELPAELSRRAQMSTQAALEGENQVYDPQTGSVVDSSEVLLGAPMLNAPGTAISIAQAGDAGGMVLGIMGGTRAKSGKKTKQQVDTLRKKGLEEQDLWDAQSGQKNRGYYAESDGQFRFEIDTSDAKFASDTLDLKPYTGTNLEDVMDFPELYEEYPDLRKLKITRLTPEMNNNKSVYLKADYNEAGDAIRLGVDPEMGLDKPTLAALLHEVQHAVQGREGFERGASSTFLYPSLDNAQIAFDEEKKNLIDNATVEFRQKLSQEAQSILPFKPINQVLVVEGLGLDVSDIRKIAEFSKYSPEQRELALDALAEKYKGRTNTRGNEYTRGSMETAVNDVQKTIKRFGDVDKMLAVRGAIEEFLPRFYSIEKGVRDIAEMSMESGKSYLRVPGEVEARTVESTFLEQKGAGRDVYPTLRTEDYNPEKALDPDQYIYPIEGRTRPLAKALGGGVGSMAPVARNMFRGYDNIRRGVGAYAPYVRRA